ncbi:MAG: aspartate carbamoyltransferase catalytic subunit [Anaerotignum sp.]|nr:aspartate carbamoyltransferase catalytic subunit [Anaerotignum sp.]MBQ3616361.1 aspartate carbamoyltransferase catalytic subunit [Anaerotignum sp.]MBQ7083904.1 aspartate carbamoyltransferase catalytic subunit [Anaerotignum sp.]
MPLKSKDFFGLRDMSADDIRYILGTAETMKYILNQKNKKTPHLLGKSVIMLFYEQSARAKLAYELAAQHLSANVIDMTNSVHSIEMESLQDMGQLIDQMGADFIILRHPMAGAPKLLADCVGASVINAGDGFNENPGQSLLDLLTIKEQKGGFEGLKVAIVGDLMHSRVSKSNIWGLTKLGAEVSVSGPSTLMLPEIEKFGVNVCYDAREAVNNADVILTTRMRMETQDKFFLPSLDEYKRFFRIDENLLKYAKKDAIVMHPGPIQRGIEISPGVIDGKQCIINDQIANSVAVRMAMFYILSQVGGAFK